jgi:hypothetical protein
LARSSDPRRRTAVANIYQQAYDATGAVVYGQTVVNVISANDYYTGHYERSLTLAALLDVPGNVGHAEERKVGPDGFLDLRK